LPRGNPPGKSQVIKVTEKDVPEVAVTLNTNDFGDVRTLAILAQVPPTRRAMTANADSANGNLLSGSTYLHGVCLADFAVVCGNLPGVSIWSPVQSECDLGTLANNIDQTLFMDKVFVNSIEFSYSTGANSTENYGGETDNKMWLLNDGRFVNYIEATVSGVGAGFIDLTSYGFDATTTIATLSDGGVGFLRKDEGGNPSVTFYDVSDGSMKNVKVAEGTIADEDFFVFNEINSRLYFPTANADVVVADGDIIQMIFAADKYSTAAQNKYFEILNVANRPSEVGTLRQGQVEIYLYDPDGAGALDSMWRLTGATISADLTREPLLELGRLAPYDRPLTMPIPITVTVESTAGDLENYARFAGLNFKNIDDISLSDLMNKDNMILVVKVFAQTDETAGGTGVNRKALTLQSGWYMEDGIPGTYATATAKERALKTVIVKNLKITDEGGTLDLGSNATQTFGFRCNNDLFVVKGDISTALIPTVSRNATV
jgi:hypothetical protein